MDVDGNTGKELLMRRVLSVLFVLLCGLSLVCSREQAQLNLVIIGVDTLRRDHLGCYGYERRTSPNIDRLAAEGVLFEELVSQAPWTLPSFASIFTSLYPSQHGAGLQGSGAGSFGQRMRSGFPTLAMMLLKHGYTTSAIVNAPLLAPEFGVDRGFEYYLTAPRWDERDARETTEAALNWIDRHGSGPFFIFVHYFDPHVTYEPPAPYDTLFDPGYHGRIGNSFDRDAYFRLEDWLSKVEDPGVQAAWKHIMALYDGEIAYTDEAIGEFLEGLEVRGLRSNTLIVLISDHGEEFFDHGGFEHGHTLYDELVNVPLIMSLPGKLPIDKRFRQQVRSIDVLPTIMEIMRMDVEAHLEGVSLCSLIEGGNIDEASGKILPAGYAYSESMLYGTEKKAVVSYPWKLVYDIVTGREELFNLKDDPDEDRNLVEGKAEVAIGLEEVLFKTVFSMVGTWHIEIASLGGHQFDIEMQLPTRPILGSFKMWQFFDGTGHVLRDQVKALEYSRGGEMVLEVSDIEVNGTVEMVAQVSPLQVPCTFDIKIDGEYDAERVYLGPGLQHPASLPFTYKMRRRGVTAGEAEGRPKQPYVLVWHTNVQYGPSAPARMSDDTKRKLKALGYIQ